MFLRTSCHFVFSGGLVTKHMTKTFAYIPKYNYFKLVSSNKSLIIIIIMIRDLLEVNYYFYTYFRQSQNINS